jgi:hypothetical protein
MRRTIFGALLAASIMIAGAVQATPLVVSFGIVPFGASPTYAGPDLQSATAFNFGGGSDVVNVILPNDQSGLSLLDTVTLSPSFNLGAGLSGTTDLLKSWTGRNGTFSELLTSFVVDRSTPNALTGIFTGVLTTPGNQKGPVELIFSANQSGGPGFPTNWAITNVSTVTLTSLPRSLVLFATGLAGLGIFVRRRDRQGP